jgi:thiol-disulfide isomerase/thioredoxin
MAEARTQTQEPRTIPMAQLAQLAFIVLASVGVFSFVRAARNDYRIASCSALCALQPTYAARNRTVPDFELPDMTGKKVRFSSLSTGKPVILNFWTKTCRPCLEEMPSLAALAQIVAKDGVKVVTVCTDEGPEAVRDHLEVILGGKPPPFAILFDPEAEVVSDKFGTTLYPETWFIDGDRVIRARLDGKRDDWTDPVVLDVIRMLGRPGGCPVQFARGRATGPFHAMCGEDE